MVNEGLRCFVLLNGKRMTRLEQHFSCFKKATFSLFFTCWFGHEKKMENLFLVVFLVHKENKMRKFQTTFACFKKATDPQSFFGNRVLYCFESGEMLKEGKILQRWEANRQQNTFMRLTFFSRYIHSSELRRRSSKLKLVEQHVKMKPAKRLS